MSKKQVKVRSIEGRMIVSATIRGGDSENGPSLELRLSGDKYFEFSCTSKVATIAQTCIADDGAGQLENIDRRIFGVTNIVDQYVGNDD